MSTSTAQTPAGAELARIAAAATSKQTPASPGRYTAVKGAAPIVASQAGLRKADPTPVRAPPKPVASAAASKAAPVKATKPAPVKAPAPTPVPAAVASAAKAAPAQKRKQPEAEAKIEAAAEVDADAKPEDVGNGYVESGSEDENENENEKVEGEEEPEEDAEADAAAEAANKVGDDKVTSAASKNRRPPVVVTHVNLVKTMRDALERVMSKDTTTAPSKTRHASASFKGATAIKQVVMDALDRAIAVCAPVLFHTRGSKLTAEHVAFALADHGLSPCETGEVLPANIKRATVIRYVRERLISIKRATPNAPGTQIQLSDSAVNSFTTLVSNLISTIALRAATWTKLAGRATIFHEDVACSLDGMKDGFKHSLPHIVSSHKRRRASKKGEAPTEAVAEGDAGSAADANGASAQDEMEADADADVDADADKPADD